ncbi:MAG: ShlB/FhaC/HecB family hemolysin secretion/activation protein [Neisseriaceae bacterium]|nr:ShlB/FhaC/HecB family hemolysin secretion/activation protein [Neisseriaceae bacterium]
MHKQSHLRLKPLAWSCATLLLSVPAWAQTPTPTPTATSALQLEEQRRQAQEQQRARDRQQQLQQQVQPSRDVRLDAEEVTAPAALSYALPQNESPCFPVQTVELVGEEAARFQFALKAVLRKTSFKAGQCLGAQGVNQLMTLIQNHIIEAGYTTTRVLAAPQDLANGTLTLTVFPGRIGALKFDDAQPEQTHVGRIQASHNAFPLNNGDVLNLHALEQGLENLKRVPTAEADIQIVPTDHPNESDVVVSWAQRTVPYRFNFSVDDSGSKSTGKYQGSVTLSIDNPLGLSDLLYASYNQDLGYASKAVDEQGREDGSGTHGYAFHYSVPYDNWLFAFNTNRYSYDQAIAGLTENYNYSGTSENTDIGVTRLLFRNAKHKTSATFKGWLRTSTSFINDAELTDSNRRVAGWTAQLNHRAYLGSNTLDLGLGYKRGTGGKEAKRAIEEDFGEGSSRMKVITLDASLLVPFQLGSQNLSYDTAVRAQFNKTPLLTQDMMSIGGRYSVRGFDGEVTLMAERGWTWQNNFTWAYAGSHQTYVGVDMGHVSGPSAGQLLGQTLIGGVFGLKGQFGGFGNLYYDLFAGKAIKKPQYFQTANIAYGFNLSYSF